MKKKLILAFSQLENEMEEISKEQSRELKGGTLSDCVIEAVSFATGMEYNDVLDSYGAYMASNVGGSAASWELDAVTNGINDDHAGAFATSMGLTNFGDTPQGPNGTSVSGDVSMALIDNGDGTGHAVVLTGNASATEYYYYDPQSGQTGTISKSDPSIIATYGY